MSAAKATPGPWAKESLDAEERELYGKEAVATIVDPSGLTIAVVVALDEDDPRSVAEAEADGDLLAAAPDLADAVEALMRAAGTPGWALACADAANALRDAGRVA